MAIEVSEGGMTITGDHIEVARLIALRSGLHLEIKTGMRLSRGRSASQIATDFLKLHGVVAENKRPNKVTVYRLLNQFMVEAGLEDKPLS